MATSDSISNPSPKRCTKCGQEYPATSQYFCADKRQKSGLRPNCRSCHNAASKRWREQNPEKARAVVKRFRENNPEKVKASRKRHPETARAASKRYRDKHPQKAKLASERWILNHPEQKRATKKRWRENNPEKVREIDKRYRENNPEQVRIRNRRRDATKITLPSTFTKLDWERALEYFHGCCAYCGNPPSPDDRHGILHQEHFKPLSQGGGYTAGNIVPACQSCNLSKGDRDAYEWALERFGHEEGNAAINRIREFFSKGNK